MSDTGTKDTFHQTNYSTDTDLYGETYKDSSGYRNTTASGKLNGSYVYVQHSYDPSYHKYKTEIYDSYTGQTTTREGYNYGGDDGFGFGNN